MDLVSPDNSVKLVSYNPLWPRDFELEKFRCLERMPAAKIEHIGSTAVPGLMAKPIIDILAGAPAETDFSEYLLLLKGLGYVQEGLRPGHSWLTSPSPQNRRFILHLVLLGQGEWKRRLAFRDLLQNNLVKAMEYQALKEILAKKHCADLGAYTKAKSAFVNEVLK
jgi:GrpB-like predicted nucleotidyltransferase (UPF0157 family)